MIKFSLPRPFHLVSVALMLVNSLRIAGFPPDITALICSAGLRRVFCTVVAASKAITAEPLTVKDNILSEQQIAKIRATAERLKVKDVNAYVETAKQNILKHR